MRTVISRCQLRVQSMVFVNPVLNLVTVMPDQTLNRPRSSISQSADSMPFDLLSQLPQHINFGIVSLTDLHSLQSVSQPAGAFSARSALSTTLVLIEFTQSKDSFDDIS